MSNPYVSTGAVSTVASSISGKGDASFDDWRDSTGGSGGGGSNGDGSNGGGRGEHVPGTPALSATEVLIRLLGYVKPHAALFAFACIASVVTVVLQLYVPVLTGQAIDTMIGARSVLVPQLLELVLRLALVVAGAAVTQWVQGYCVNRLSYQTVRDLRVEAHDKLDRLPLAFVDSHPHGDIISRVVNDVDQIGDGLLQGFTNLLTGVVTIVGTLAFMLSISVPMAIVVVLVTPLSILAASLIARFSNESFATQQRVQGQLSAHVEEYVGNQKLVGVFSYGDRAEERFDGLNRQLYTAGERAQFLSSLSNPGTRFINNIIYAVVGVIGCACVITGFPSPLTIGGVQTFLSYANQYTKPFNEVTGVVTQIQAAWASARRTFALIDACEEEPDAPDAIEMAAPTGDVELSDVSFGYVPGHPVLHDVSVHAKPGMRVALVGPTGCGKTTLINLLLRFYDVDSGSISLDGVDIKKIARSSLRHAFGMVLQDTWLFEGTVHDNIAYGRPDATREEVVEAAQRARAHAFIEVLPSGYDTVIGEGGGTFSQGQRQLLCIARVMLTNPAILVLDEATSSIDTRTEMQVQTAFDEMVQGRTSFIVAHRLSTIQNADCILMMCDGRVVERGTHDELLAHGGAYAELYLSQFAE